jgi:hypothetical protein
MYCILELEHRVSMLQWISHQYLVQKELHMQILYINVYFIR